MILSEPSFLSAGLSRVSPWLHQTLSLLLISPLGKHLFLWPQVSLKVEGQLAREAGPRRGDLFFSWER